jgi:hypothetical protein
MNPRRRFVPMNSCDELSDNTLASAPMGRHMIKPIRIRLWRQMHSFDLHKLHRDLS